MEWPTKVGVDYGQMLYHRWQMEWPEGHFVYFSFSSGQLHRTSSHMWGRWYLPMFLFRDGLLTLIYKASFMVLMRFWSSLPTMLKLSMLIYLFLMWIYFLFSLLLTWLRKMDEK